MNRDELPVQPGSGCKIAPAISEWRHDSLWDDNSDGNPVAASEGVIRSELSWH